MKYSGSLVFFIITSSLFSCKTEEIILHGEISGFVTDTANNQPLQAIPVKLNPINDTTSTASDGKYLFKSLIPGDYKIEVSKPPYSKSIRNVAVTSANISVVDFALHKIPYPEFSERYLDFGSDSTLKSFTITNTGTGKLKYFLTASQEWITVYPASGESTTETDTFKVTINRTGLSGKKQIESIEVISHVGFDLVRDTIYVFLNGIMDQDKNYYGIVTIGTQTWLAENLNTGNMIINSYAEPKNNGIVEKYCYDDKKINCDIYGGLYSWPEMMDYNNPDPKPVGTTQGICPTGWHIPTLTEWQTLVDFQGGSPRTGGKLKETGFDHWNEPNTLATNESGFTGLGAGFLGFIGGDLSTFGYHRLKVVAVLWVSDKTVHDGVDYPYHFGLIYNNETGGLEYYPSDPIDLLFCSVRCIKDLPKK